MTPRQMTLDELPLPKHRSHPCSIDDGFAAFHARNPHVYAALVRLARRALVNGHAAVGMKHLWEVMRWELHTSTVRGPADDDFRLNNNWTSRYARLIASEHPELACLFEFRRLRSR